MSLPGMWLVVYEFVRQVGIGFAVTFGPPSMLDRRRTNSPLDPRHPTGRGSKCSHECGRFIICGVFQKHRLELPIPSNWL
jgi:hypothetical protein